MEAERNAGRKKGVKMEGKAGTEIEFSLGGNLAGVFVDCSRWLKEGRVPVMRNSQIFSLLFFFFFFLSLRAVTATSSRSMIAKAVHRL